MYCAHEECEASVKLAKHLYDCGYFNVIEYPGGLKEWFSKGDGFFDDADTEEEGAEEVSPEDRLDENEETIVYDGVEYIHRINEEEDEPGEILLKDNMEVIGYYDGEDIEWISPKEWRNHKKRVKGKGGLLIEEEEEVDNQDKDKKLFNDELLLDLYN